MRRRAPVVLCLLAVLGLIVGSVAASKALTRSPQRGVAAPTVSDPVGGNVERYSASVTNGSTQNDLYEWLGARAGKIVHVSVSISKPVLADLKSRPQKVTMSSNCKSSSPPSNCDRSLNLAGTSYLVYGETKGLVTYSNGVYYVDADFAVQPVTLDAQGFYTLPLRVVILNGPGDGERD